MINLKYVHGRGGARGALVGPELHPASGARYPMSQRGGQLGTLKSSTSPVVTDAGNMQVTSLT